MTVAADYIRCIVQYSIQFFSDYPETIFDCGTMLIAAISAFCAFLAYKHQRERAAKAAACDLAQYYAHNIIEKYSFIFDVYSSSGYTEMVKRAFPIGKIKVFTHQETVDFLMDSEIDISDILGKLTSISEESILTHKLRYAKSSADRAQYIQEYSHPENAKDTLPHFPPLLKEDFYASVNSLLNDLEWFSMQCRYGVADEKLLYQSIHQTFLAEVQLLYLSISLHNENSEDKFYTNIIWLFDVWKKRLAKYRRKNQKAQARAARKIEQAKIKAKYAGQSTHHGRPI